MILGLGHKKGVGKDTTARLISSLTGFERAAFADNLYDIGEQLYGWAGFKNRTYYEVDYKAKERPLTNGRTPREILIDIGMKMRDVDKDIWVSPIIHRSNIVISDLRFPNEFDQIQSKGFCVKIVRPGWPESDDSADTALDGETRWDYTLVNDDNLRSNVVQMLKYFNIPQVS